MIENFNDVFLRICMSYVRIVILCSVLSQLFGCTTRYARVEPLAPISSPTVNIVNSQAKNDIRTIFTDGITTFESNYYDWNEKLKVMVEQRFKDNGTQSYTSFALEIYSIRCGGHYIGDCEVTVALIINSNKIRLTSDKHNGYPWGSALDKALNNVADKISKNDELLSQL
jgi:hypothetical protein